MTARSHPAADRAAVVALRDGWLLAVRRERHGRRYAVLPGGGVERDETAAAAALRELDEETGLRGEVRRHLWTLRHADRTADYFLVEVPVAPMTMTGPEAGRATPANSYRPCWIRLADLEAENLQPEELRPLLLALVAPS